MKLGDVDIDKTSLKVFGRLVVEECIKFYQDPENMKRFEAWKAERDKSNSMLTNA